MGISEDIGIIQGKYAYVESWFTFKIGLYTKYLKRTSTGLSLRNFSIDLADLESEDVENKMNDFFPSFLATRATKR